MERWKVGTRAAVAFVVLSIVPSFHLSAQDTSRVNRPAALLVRPDTSHLVGPMGAFWRSFLVPGWGQSATGRHTTGAVFVAWEGVTAMMTLKAQQEANYMKQIGSSNLKAKRQEGQDWLVLWGFNHLFSGAGGFVSPHLQDFSRGPESQAVPPRLGVPPPLRGTAGTIASGAYERAIKALRPDARVHAHACPLFVPLVEEGWFDHPATELIAREYLEPLKQAGVDVLVLGCTHYPLLKALLARVM